MNTELDRLIKLVNRKKEYLQHCEKQKIKDAVNAEINIILQFIDAALKQNLTTETYIGIIQIENSTLRDQVMKLEGICLIYGIEFYEIQKYLRYPIQVIVDEIKADREKGEVRVPDKIIPHIKQE